MKRILVLGKEGQLAKAIARNCDKATTRYIGKEQLDLKEHSKITSCLAAFEFDVLINCMAYTAVDAAEENEETARALNVLALPLLAAACKAQKAEIIHISTDYVFGDAPPSPITENQATAPTGVYGQSKLDGENALRSSIDEHFIIRTAWLYSTDGHNFLNTMLRLGKERTELQVVFDQIGTPTWADDLAKAILLIANSTRENGDYGTYHFSNEGVCSWYDFAQAIFELSDISIRLRPILSSQYPTPAKRPKYSVLDKQKIKSSFGLTIPHWRESLVKCLQSINLAHV